jgi:hypothetical protein
LGGYPLKILYPVNLLNYNHVKKLSRYKSKSDIPVLKILQWGQRHGRRGSYAVEVLELGAECYGNQKKE